MARLIHVVGRFDILSLPDGRYGVYDRKKEVFIAKTHNASAAVSYARNSQEDSTCIWKKKSAKS